MPIQESHRGELIDRYGPDIFASASDFRSEVNGAQRRETILLDDGINDSTSKTLINKLRDINAKDPAKEIVLRINSNGGTLQGAMDIASYVHYIDNPVTTIAESRAMSGAALILANGDRGRRLAHEDAKIMIHQVQLTINSWQGSIPQFMEYAKAQFRLNKEFLMAFSEATGVPFVKLWQDSTRDLYLTAPQALDYGVIDRIIPRQNKGASYLPGPIEQAKLSAVNPAEV